MRGHKVNNAPPAILAHTADAMTDRMKSAGQHYGDHRIPLGGVKVLHGLYILKARIIHQNINTAEGLCCPIDHFLNLLRLAYIRSAVDRGNAVLFQSKALGLNGIGLTKPVHDNIRTSLGKRFGNPKPYAGR